MTKEQLHQIAQQAKADCTTYADRVVAVVIAVARHLGLSRVEIVLLLVDELGCPIDEETLRIALDGSQEELLAQLLDEREKLLELFEPPALLERVEPPALPVPELTCTGCCQPYPHHLMRVLCPACRPAEELHRE